ncbi:MAG: class I SAM-dependent methyltransferase, partial [Bacteroidota bacterium]|nr:class I SAM-dependent methyltransferase [Bacteroidota bacterium]
MSWYKQWFADELYMELYAHRDTGEARQAIDLFERVAEPVRGRRVLDLACGTGRHAFELARRGAYVIAADLSPTLLAAARRRTRRHARQLLLARADMRRLPVADASLDAVLQLFTAFGYFGEDAENARVIGGVRRCLRVGGHYLLDYLNAAQVRATLVPRSTQIVNGIDVVQERRLTDTRVEKRIRIRSEKGERVFEESVRLFTLDEFHRMFRENGFVLDQVAGDYDGAPFTDD